MHPQSHSTGITPEIAFTILHWYCTETSVVFLYNLLEKICLPPSSLLSFYGIVSVNFYLEILTRRI